MVVLPAHVIEVMSINFMELSREQIEHIAKLARLDLTAAEIKTLGKELSAVFGYIDQLKEVDTSAVEPTAQVTGLNNVWREDTVTEWDDNERQAALKEAPHKEGDFLKVKRVID